LYQVLIYLYSDASSFLSTEAENSWKFALPLRYNIHPHGWLKY